jgi:hypothetical protein
MRNKTFSRTAPLAVMLTAVLAFASTGAFAARGGDDHDRGDRGHGGKDRGHQVREHDRDRGHHYGHDKRPRRDVIVVNRDHDRWHNHRLYRDRGDRIYVLNDVGHRHYLSIEDISFMFGLHGDNFDIIFRN